MGGLALTLAALPCGVVWVSTFVIAFFISGTALNAGVAGTVARQGNGPYARYVTASDFGAAVGPIAGWVAVDALSLDTVGLIMGAATYLSVALFAAIALKDAQP